MGLLPVSDIWECGRQLTKKLATMGITTALRLADSNQALPAKQQIIVSRSFGQRVTQLPEMHQAVCKYAERAAEKLRREKQYCRHISVFVRTSPFAPHEAYYANSHSVQLMLATKTRDIVAAAVKALKAIWRDGFLYQKAGIMLNDFCDKPSLRRTSTARWQRTIDESRRWYKPLRVGKNLVCRPGDKQSLGDA